MARPSTAARALSLTEELEKLEQSITLTLQGKARRRVSTTRPGSPAHQRSTTTSARPTES